MLEGDLLFGANGLRWEARFQLREEFRGSAGVCGNVHFSQRRMVATSSIWKLSRWLHAPSAELAPRASVMA
jgi:hypothetical protein